MFCKTHHIPLATFTATLGFPPRQRLSALQRDATNRKPASVRAGSMGGGARLGAPLVCQALFILKPRPPRRVGRVQTNSEQGNMPMFVPGPGWFFSAAAAAALVSLRFRQLRFRQLQPPRCLRCPVDADVTLRSSRGGRPSAWTSGAGRAGPSGTWIEWFCCFFLERPEGFFAVVFFSG